MCEGAGRLACHREACQQESRAADPVLRKGVHPVKVEEKCDLHQSVEWPHGEVANKSDAVHRKTLKRRCCVLSADLCQ